MDGALGTPETPYGVQQGGEGADGYFGSGVSGGGTGGGEMESGGSGMAVEELLPKISLVPSVTTSVPSTDRPPVRSPSTLDVDFTAEQRADDPFWKLRSEHSWSMTTSSRGS